MTTLRSILSLAFLLASSGTLLTASQAKTTTPAATTAVASTGTSSSNQDLQTKKQRRGCLSALYAWGLSWITAQQPETTIPTESTTPEKETKIIANYRNSAERNEKLTALLYDLLPTMPLDLIKIIAGYDYLMEGKCVVTIDTPPSEYGYSYFLVLAAFPDGRIVSGLDRTVIIWKPTTDTKQQITWKAERSFKMKYGINAFVLLDNERLVVGTAGEIIILTKKDGGYLKKDISLNEDMVNCLAVLPNDRLASGGQDEKIKIWNLTTGHCERELTGHADAIFSLCALPNDLLASGSTNSIKIWNLTKKSSGECIGELTHDPNRFVTSLIALPHNKMASAGSGNKIMIWNLTTMQCERTLIGGECIHPRLFIVLLPDGTIASGAHSDTIIKIWNLTQPAEKECVSIFTDYQNGHTNSLTLLPNGKLVSGSDENTFRIWE